MLLDLDLLALEELHVFEFADPALKGCLTSIVKDPCNNGFQNAKQLPPRDAHDDEHDEVEQSKLQDDEEAVEDKCKEDDGPGVVDSGHAAGS